MKRRQLKIDNIDEEISIVPKSNTIMLSSYESISGNTTPEQKNNIINFFYNLYDTNERNYDAKRKEEFYGIVGILLNDRIPTQTLCFGDVKNMLLKEFPFLNRNK